MHEEICNILINSVLIFQSMSKTETYNLYAVIKERLMSMDFVGRDKVQDRVNWLSGEIGISPRWISGSLVMEKVQFGDLLNISKALNFDLIADYYKWLGETGPQNPTLQEEPLQYSKQQKAEQVTVQVTIRTDAKKAGKIIADMKLEAEKSGGEML